MNLIEALTHLNKNNEDILFDEYGNVIGIKEDKYIGYNVFSNKNIEISNTKVENEWNLISKKEYFFQDAISKGIFIRPVKKDQEFPFKNFKTYLNEYVLTQDTAIAREILMNTKFNVIELKKLKGRYNNEYEIHLGKRI